MNVVVAAAVFIPTAMGGRGGGGTKWHDLAKQKLELRNHLL